MTRWDDGNLHVTIWADHAPQIEIWTTRGQSQVYREKEALKFAAWLRDNLPATEGMQLTDTKK